MFDGFEEAQNNGAGPDYQVLARRTRPQSFSELVGQEAAVKAIGGMIESGRIPHAFLFTGTRGTGKTSSARILAKSLCCSKGPTLEPCQTCTHCVQITACAHEDVFEIDGASHTGVDNIRELRESARFYPQSGRFKIFIIDEVHMLSIGAFNALLKTLEEPPPQVIFILATTELHKVPVTVRSRCMILSFKKIDPSTIASHLARLLDKDGIPYTADALQLIAREAKGSLRDSLSLLEQVLALGAHRSVNFDAAKAALSVMGEGICQNLFAGILSKDPQMCLQAVAETDSSSLDFSHVLEQTSLLFRNAIVLKQAGRNSAAVERANHFLNLLPAELSFIENHTAEISIAALVEIYRALAHAAREILRTNAQKAWAEVTIMDCISRSEWLSADDLSQLLTQGAAVSVTASTPAGPKQTTEPAKVLPKTTVPQPQNLRTDGGSQNSPLRPEQSDGAMMELYSTLISKIQEKSVQLAVKLKHAKLAQFNRQKLVFTDCPENKLFAQLSESEADIFSAALSAIGCAECRIEGLELPAKVTRKMTAQNSEPATPSPRQNPAGAKPAGKALDAIASLSREDPFATPRKVPPADQKKNEPAEVLATGGVSLASVEQAEEARKWNLRQTELRSRPLLRKLEALGAEIELIPLNSTDRRN
ncbi:MAG: DNA polymerase III subunit gamma/tau [Proteobacteria bacterium]|nr:DNA polymerase III subunit gamma/tau [Pseudomonadota bacterium]